MVKNIRSHFKTLIGGPGGAEKSVARKFYQPGSDAKISERQARVWADPNPRVFSKRSQARITGFEITFK